jgi:bromodomain adjacent to zinc finger domain protein 1A
VHSSLTTRSPSSSYAARLAFYNQKIFQCELTGKIGLSYWEAVESERHEALDLHHRFPEALKAPVLRSVQFVVTGRLDILVDLAFERFKDRFWPDENVLVEVQGDR